MRHGLRREAAGRGAFLAQRRLRHKCSKRSYQFVFWLIVLAWQFAAVDSLQNWKFSKAAAKLIESHASIENEMASAK